MADTTVEADAGSGGALFAVDDISGTTHPYVKIELGAAGQDNNPVHSSNPMPIEGGASGRPVSTFAVNTPNPSSTFIMGSAAGSVPVSTYAVNAAATSVQSTWAVGQDIPISTFARADNFISTNNSWTATTAASSTWTANGDDVSNYNAVTIQLATDVDSAASSMRFEFSNDNTNWDDTYNFTMDVSASSTRRFQFPVTAQYFRNRYTNGGTDQGYFRVQTIYHSAAPGTSIHRLGDDTSPDRSAQVVKSAIMAIGSGGGANFVNVGATNGGNLKISVEESVQVDVNIAAQDDPVSTYAVNNPAPVGTQSTWALNKTSTHIVSQTGPVSTFAVNKTSTHIAGQSGPVSTYVVGSLTASSATHSTFTAGSVPVSTHPQPSALGGLSVAYKQSLTTAAFQIHNGPAQLHQVWFTNTATSTRWLKFYDAGAVTVGTTPPTFVFGLPAVSTFSNAVSGFMPAGAYGIQFGTSTFVAATAVQATNSAVAPGSNEVTFNAFYKS
jgi:hypothetical protein